MVYISFDPSNPLGVNAPTNVCDKNKIIHSATPVFRPRIRCVLIVQNSRQNFRNGNFRNVIASARIACCLVGMLLLMRIIQRTCEVNCEQFYSFSPN